MLVCVRLRHVAGIQWGNKKYMNRRHLEMAMEDISIADWPGWNSGETDPANTREKLHIRHGLRCEQTVYGHRLATGIADRVSNYQTESGENILYSLVPDCRNAESAAKVELVSLA